MNQAIKIKNIAYFSSSPIGENVLNKLCNSEFKPILVITKPDIIKNKENSMAIVAQKNNIKTLKPTNLKDEAFINNFKEQGIDIAIVFSYGKIIPQEVLDIPKYGFINIHPSLLPKYRGPSPIQTAILKGDRKTGVSIIKLDAKMDHGPILEQKEFNIPDNYTLKDLEQSLVNIGSNLMFKCLEKIPPGKIQNDELATFTKKFSIEDGFINSSMSIQQAFNIFRALSSEPGCFITWQDKNLKVLDCKISNIPKQETNNTLFRYNNRLYFKCLDGNLEIIRLQKSGGKAMQSKDFINGYPNQLPPSINMAK